MQKRNRNSLESPFNPFMIKKIELEIPHKDETGVTKIFKYKTWTIIHKKSGKPLVYGKFSDLLPKLEPLRILGANILVSNKSTTPRRSANITTEVEAIVEEETQQPT